ncbi:hypothetical protein GEMRC1_002026 [Eukaryota sp. GEM-RC1]
MIDSKRLGSGNISADWLSMSDSEFSGDAFTNCVGRCFVSNDVSNIISILNNHDLVFQPPLSFTNLRFSVSSSRLILLSTMKLTTLRFSVDLGEIIFYEDVTISDCQFDLVDPLSTSVLGFDLPYSSQIIVLADVFIQSNSSTTVPFVFHGSISFHDVTFLSIFSHSTFSYSSSLSSSKHLLIFGTLLVQGKWSVESTLLLNSGTVVFDPSSLFNFTNLDLRSSKVYLLHVPNSINSIVLDNSQLCIQHINHDLLIPFVKQKSSKMNLDSIDGQVEIFNLLLISSEFNITNCYPFFVIRVLQTSYSQINLNSGSLSVVENLTNRVDSDFLGNDPYIFFKYLRI